MTTQTTHYLFVYGTLLRNAQHPMHDLLRQHACFYAQAQLQARLYRIADYPGAVLSTSEHDNVYGEVYALSSPHSLLPQMDDYEECSSAFPQPHEYCRQQVKVITEHNEHVEAWTYLYHYRVSEQQRILSGRFLEEAEINVF